jgi:peptide/nickel transport system ATP-binding protein
MLQVENLGISFAAANGKLVPVVQEVSFSLAAGEVLALVGESGSGKTLTALTLMRLLPPNAQATGSITFEGRDLLQLSEEAMRRLRGAEMAMIFQEPMTALNPVMRVGEQVAEAVRAHQDVSRKEARELALAALDDAALPDAVRRYRDYPHQLSGGMRQRVMIAMALVNRTKLLIADEPTTALDVTLQAQIMELLRDLQRKYKLAVLFISHDLALVSRFAQRVAVMYAGSIVEVGSVQQVLAHSAHPYTRGLLQAMPKLASRREQALTAIEGTVPAPGSRPPGCAFEPRCAQRIAACAQTPPPLLAIAAGHGVRCPVSLEQAKAHVPI